MSRDEILKKVQDIFRDNFDDETLNISNGTSAVDIDDWDSFEQINLILTMESEFKVKFDISEVVALKDVGDMVNLIAEKLRSK